MRWNGTVITSDIPTLIFHDELFSGTGDITNRNGPGRLVCTSTTQDLVHWAYPTDGGRIMPLDNSSNFFVRREGSVSSPPIVSRLSLNSANPITAPVTGDFANGLWRCNEQGGPSTYVGIYARSGGVQATSTATPSKLS